MPSHFFSCGPESWCAGNKQSELLFPFILRVKRPTAKFAVTLCPPVTGLRRRNSWKHESSGLMRISIVLTERTYCSKHCTSFPLAGYKAC